MGRFDDNIEPDKVQTASSSKKPCGPCWPASGPTRAKRGRRAAALSTANRNSRSKGSDDNDSLGCSSECSKEKGRARGGDAGHSAARLFRGRPPLDNRPRLTGQIQASRGEFAIIGFPGDKGRRGRAFRHCDRSVRHAGRIQKDYRRPERKSRARRFLGDLVWSLPRKVPADAGHSEKIRSPGLDGRLGQHGQSRSTRPGKSASLPSATGRADHQPGESDG